MSKFTRKVKKNMAKSNKILNTPLYTVEYYVKNGNHCFKCVDCSGGVNSAMIPSFCWDFLMKDGVDKEEFKENFMRGFGDTNTVLSYREDLRYVFNSFNSQEQTFLIWACGIYHNNLLSDSMTTEDHKKCYDTLYKPLQRFSPGVPEWFNAYTKTFVDMGGQIGWSPVAMEVSAA